MHEAHRRWSLLVALVALVALVPLAGCIPSFDRCRIPGTAGCPSASDGAVADAAMGCPPEPTSTPLFATDFDDVTIDLFTISGDATADWAIEEGELRQRERNADGAQAVLAGITEPDVRLIARMRRIADGGSGALELAVRVSATDSYHCNWEPANGDFEIQRSTMMLALDSRRVDVASIPGYDPSALVTMDFAVDGSVLRCCLREIPGASLTVVDDALATGSPGARTYRLSAAYDDLAVHPAM